MNWLKSNILERLQNANLNFNIQIIKSDFEKVSFDCAANNVATKIQELNKKIFVSFSGGYDSEFIVRKLNSLKIEFIPIIVQLETQSSEREYAYKTIRDLGIKAKIIKMSNREYVDLYVKYIHKAFNSFESPPIAPFILEYVHAENGILIDGTCFGGMNPLPLHTENTILGKKQFEKIIFDEINNDCVKYNFVSNQEYYIREQDSYWQYLFPNSFFSFFMYTPQIVFSMLDSILPTDFTWNDYKQRIFNLTWRPKLRICNLQNNDNFMRILSQIDLKRKYKPNNIVYFGNKEKLKNLITN